jgi:cytochrome c556
VGCANILTEGIRRYDPGMSRYLILFAICAGIVSAQDEATYQGWMKSVPPQINAVKAAIMASDNAKVAEEANKLSDTFQKVADFWQGRMKDDAVTMAKAARDAAKEAAQAKTADAQNAAVTKVQGTCGGCHRVYREGTAGNFKIKG